MRGSTGLKHAPRPSQEGEGAFQEGVYPCQRRGQRERRDALCAWCMLRQEEDETVGLRIMRIVRIVLVVIRQVMHRMRGRDDKVEHERHEHTPGGKLWLSPAARPSYRAEHVPEPGKRHTLPQGIASHLLRVRGDNVL